MPRRFPPGLGAFGLLARLRSLWRGLRRRRQVEAEMAEEFRHHLELRTRDLIAQGLSKTEARRRAHIEFGHVERHKEAARAARGLRLFDQLGLSWLDLKLGARMLAKYPGLSLVSVVGMAVAIALGAGGFGFIHALDTPLPLDEGSRVVALQNADVRVPGTVDRHAARDFLAWRTSLRSVRNLSAFADDEGVLSLPDGSTTLIRLARMTASGFRVARVAPILGRALLDDDERPGMAPVLVISYEEWRDRFGADPKVVGRPVRLDGTIYTVAGVMPEGFRFPINHRYWTSLHLDPESLGSGVGPVIRIVGRLADGATLQQAQAELSATGSPSAEADPETRRYIHPEVLPYTRAAIGVDTPARAWALRMAEFALSLLLLVVSVNVAVLVYARTVSRAGEIAVRTALGASRRRVATQLFAEALVLSLLAAGVGLGVADIGFAWIRSFVRQGAIAELPFWIDVRLGADVVAYALGLAVLAALVVGVLPALQTMGRSVQASLQQVAGRGSRKQLGRMWTALIVLQVVAAVAALPYALYTERYVVRSALATPSYPVDELVHASVSMDPARIAARSDTTAVSGFAHGVEDLVREIEADPRVAIVAYARAFPGAEDHQPVEVEGLGETSEAWTDPVDTRFFTVFDMPVVAGRGFAGADADQGSSPVVVDQTFVGKVLGGGSPLGRRIRFARRPGSTDPTRGGPGPWREIAGVVRSSAVSPTFEDAVPKVYTLLDPAAAGARLEVAVRMKQGADPAAFVGPLRQLAHTAAPGLEVDPRPAAVDEHKRRQALIALALTIVLVTASVLLLSSAGIYAMMSFTVASRRREIGIRAALGAGPRRLLIGIFARGSAQLTAGVVAGLGLAALVSVPLGNGTWFWTKAGLLLQLLVVGVMIGVGLVAVIVPARRGLAIQPTDALREE